MTTTVSPIRQGLHTVTPHLTISDSKKAIEFYKKAFNAEEKNISEMPDGKVIHAEIKIGDSYIFLHDEFRKWEHWDRLLGVDLPHRCASP